jgi:sulfonate transport system permease protein
MSVRNMPPPVSVDADSRTPPLSGVGSQSLTSVGAQDGASLSELTAKRTRAVRRRRFTVYGLRLLFAILWIGSWQLTTSMKWVDPFFFGQPSGIVVRLQQWFTQGTDLGSIWLQMGVTMEETIGGFLVGAILGVVFGVLLGRIELAADVASPFIKAANSIPRVVLGSLFAIMFGLGLKSKIATAAVLVFFVVFYNAFQGVREVDRNLIANARILGANNRRLTTEIIVPSAMSWILASLHISFGLALVGAVVGELFGATAGVGELIYSSGHLFDVDGVFAGMFLLAVMALVAEGVITALENRLIRWRPRHISGETPI